MTSCIDCPRTASGDCSPIAQSTASVTLDLPEPFGPTTTEMPVPKSSRVRSGKDLKPLSVSDLRCTSVLLVGVLQHDLRLLVLVVEERVERLLRGVLLGVLLGAPRAAADLGVLHQRDHLERPVVRRPELLDHLVRDGLAPAGQALLQRRLEVHRIVER